MGLHLDFSKNLKGSEAHDPIRKTFLGQAHIAGTGPSGRTCRECVFFALKKYRKLDDGSYEEYFVAPGHFGKKHKTRACELKNARCNKPIINKANRLIPHHAVACRLFEASPNPPVANIGAPHAQ